MTPLEFLHSGPVVALLERAATGAGVPLSIHYVERNQEGLRTAGWGQCDACRHVRELPGGGMACRLSRMTASTMAVRQQRPIPFVCHLGFACVSAALLPGEGYVMTLGPYCPMEEQRSLEEDVRAGLDALQPGTPEPDLPVTLADIHRSPAAAVPAVAEWIVEAVRAAWEAQRAAEIRAEAEPPLRPAEVAQGTSRAPQRRPPVAGDAESIAALLAAGSRKEVRERFLGELEELQRTGGRDITVRRAHMVGLAGAILESLARTGVPVAAAWAQLPAFHASLSRAESDAQLADAAAGAFGFLRRAEARGEVAAKLPNYPELFALVKDRLLDGVTLEEVAAALGETPSAISHRLKRKFGMSFSDYIARLRVEKAKQLFRRTGLSASDVARRVGIGDQSNFARLFRKVEGMSPSAYRKQYGKKP